MTEISERYNQRADKFAAVIQSIGLEQWGTSTPCPDWDARDIVRHVVDSHGTFLGFVGRDVGDIPSVDEDPGAAFAAACAVVAADLEDPERAGATFDGFFGEQTFAQGIDRFICADLLVHRWDLAHATGGDETMEPEEIESMAETAKGFGDAMRSPRTFGPALDPPEGADEQTKLLAFLGRKAW